MDSIEDFMNYLTDMDWGWYPFLFLRPPKETKMDFIILAKMGLVFGSIYGMIIYLLEIALRHYAFDLGDLVTWGSAVIVGFTVLYALTFAYCWNRRAERLRKQDKRLSLHIRRSHLHDQA